MKPSTQSILSRNLPSFQKSNPVLYLVTNRGNTPIELFCKIIQEAIEGGVNIVQLREKQSSFHEMTLIAKKLQSFLIPLGIPLIINDRMDVANEIKADGIHLGQSDIKPSEARAILGPQAFIGLSVETMNQVLNAQNEEADYLAASPVFATKTKTDCNQPWGLDRLKDLCSIARQPVIAIGGIEERNVEDVMACGVAGVAVISAIFNAKCPKTSAKSLSNKMRQFRSE